MAVISGGMVSPPGVRIEATGPTVYRTNGVPTDATISSAFTPANGDLAVNVLNNQTYERQAGVWVRIDTL